MRRRISYIFRNLTQIYTIDRLKMARSGLTEGEKDSVPVLGVRHLQVFLFFAAIAATNAMHGNLSLAIVVMTDRNSKDFVDYSTEEKSWILSSFFWGYVLTQVPGGYCARKMGAKVTLLFGILITSIMTLVTPFCAFFGDWRVPAVARIVQGMSQGVVIPCTHTLLAKWAPKEERALLGMLTYCGGQVGTVLMFAGSGYIASSPLGWPSIFYISGGVGIVWVILWLIIGASSPRDHKSITLAERTYIEKSISCGAEEKEGRVESHQLKMPWPKIFTSAPFLALMIVHITFNYGFWTLMFQIPPYLKNIHKFNIKENALLTSLPYLVMLLLDFVFAGLDALVAKFKCLSLTCRRKIFNTAAMWVPAAALAGLGYIDSNHTLVAIILLVIAVGFGAAIHMGFLINHLDLSPNFAGILISFTNGLANLTGIIAPLSVGYFVTDEGNQSQWRIVFLIAAGITFFGNLLFVICGSAKVQPFNEPDQKNYQRKTTNVAQTKF